MIHWLVVFVIGLVVGIVAKMIMPGKDPGGFFVTAIIGIAGSLVGGWIAGTVFATGAGATAAGAGVGGLWGFVFAVIGAIILLALYRLLFSKKST